MGNFPTSCGGRSISEIVTRRPERCRGRCYPICRCCIRQDDGVSCYSLLWTLGWSKGDIYVTGFLSSATGLPVSAANGPYSKHGHHHGCPVYMHHSKSFFVYYWDERDGAQWSGWWMGPSIGSATVWAHCSGPPAVTPPEAGWHSPWNGPVRPHVKFRSRTAALPVQSIVPEKTEEEVVPTWIASPGAPSKALVPEDTGNLQTCSICLEPLCNVLPSVFMVNLGRLCPHYFCHECAQRVIAEGTRLVHTLYENVCLAVVDRLPVVLNASGSVIGDLVWRANGSRLTEGEYAVVLEQITRLKEPTEGMELQYEEDKAVVLLDGARYGRLLRSTSRSLRCITREEFIADGLDGKVARESVPGLREKYTVLHDVANGSWICTQCTMSNPANEFHCYVCFASPPRPAGPMQPSKPLRSADVAALQRRFAIRPHCNWAVQLSCPLCRAHGCASLASLPDLRKAPSAWFSLADLDGSGQVSPTELVRALAAVLPVSADTVRKHLEDIVSLDESHKVQLPVFLQEGGPAHWAAQQLSQLEKKCERQSEVFGEKPTTDEE